MREIKIKILGFSILFLLLVGIKASAETVKLGVNPSIFNYQAQKGSIIKDQFTIIKDKKDIVKLSIKQDEDSKLVESHPAKHTTLEYKNDASEDKVFFNIKVPENIEDGEYIVVLEITLEGRKDFSITPSIELPIAIQVGNKGQANLQASDFKISGYTLGGKECRSLSITNLFKGNFFKNLLNFPVEFKWGKNIYYDIPKGKEITLYNYIKNMAIDFNSNSYVKSLSIDDSNDNNVKIIDNSEKELVIDVKSNETAKDILRQAESLNTVWGKGKYNIKSLLTAIKIPSEPEYSNLGLIAGYKVKNLGNASGIVSGKISLLGDNNTVLHTSNFTSTLVRPEQETECLASISLSGHTEGKYSIYTQLVGAEDNYNFKIVSIRVPLLIGIGILVVVSAVLLVIAIKKKRGVQIRHTLNTPKI